MNVENLSCLVSRISINKSEKPQPSHHQVFEVQALKAVATGKDVSHVENEDAEVMWRLHRRQTGI